MFFFVFFFVLYCCIVLHYSVSGHMLVWFFSTFVSVTVFVLNKILKGVPTFDAVVRRTPCTYGSKLTLLTFKSNAQDFMCRLSPAMSGEFTARICVAAWNREKFTKTPYFGGSRSFNVIDVGTTEKNSSAVLVMISSKSVSICNCSHARRVNNGN